MLRISKRRNSRINMQLWLKSRPTRVQRKTDARRYLTTTYAETRLAKFLPKPENVACRSILTSCRVRSAGTGSARGSDGGPNERRAWGVGREQVGCVAKTHRDAERCVIARVNAPYRLTSLPCGGPARHDPTLEPRRSAVLISGLTTGPQQGWVAGSDRFWLCELRVSQHFSTFYGSSVQSMGTQLNALPALPVLARTVSG